MKNRKHCIGMAIIAIITLTFAFTACSSGGGGGGGTAPTISTTELADGTVGVDYSAELDATGDTPITWSVSSGTLPAGLNINADTGEISGTPTTAGTSDFTVKATNAAGNDTKALSITIVPLGGAGAGPAITRYALPNGTNGTPYNETLTATGAPPITWSVEDGELPDGLNLDADTGVISGTPTKSDTFDFTITATNTVGSGSIGYRIIIYSAGAPVITTPPLLPDGTIETAYSYTLTATGDAPITWSVESGELPGGLILNANTGVISGTPTTVGRSIFSVKASNAEGSYTGYFTITIEKDGENTDEPPKISEASLPIGTVGTAYSANLTATGDTPITWSVEGTLPPGLSLTHDTDTGVISGTPTAAGRFNFYVKAVSAKGIDTRLSGITIAAPGGNGSSPVITTVTLTNGTIGTAYSYQLDATGDTPITWSVDIGVLPDGLSLNANTGVISGTPTTTGTSTFTVKVENVFGSNTRQLSIQIIAFTSITDLGTWLAARPANNVNNLYTVKLNVSDLGGSASTSGSLGAMLLANNTKYVTLDLSGSTITSIPDNAFSDNSTTPAKGCTTLAGITIPNGVTSIGWWAFRQTSLTSVTIPASVISIEWGAFAYCTSLTSVTFEGTIVSDNLGGESPAFPSDLDEKYLAGGPGTYTREENSANSGPWTKQP